MERVITRKLRAFLDEHGRLSTVQHGFRPGHSCLTQLLETIHKWAATLDRGRSTHAIFLDLAKAFDSVPHRRLLIKLNHIGVRDQVLKWIESFLIGRMQRVVVNGRSSPWASVTSGVPQRSVLGPLLFIIYVNDIMDEVSSSGGLFADDCVIYREVSHRSDVEELQRDLEIISNWTKTWQLALNVEKCEVMEITNRRTTIRYDYCVGHIIDAKLKWNNHCQSIAAKATRILNFLKRSLSGCSQRAKATAYQAMVRPHLEYCAPVWDPHAVKNIEILEKVQKRAARWLTAKWDNNSKQWNKSYLQSLSELNWRSLQQRRSYLNQCQTFKVLNGLDYIEFAKYWSYSGARQTRQWHACTIQTISSRVNAFRFSFFVSAPFVWNSLPSDVVVHILIILKLKQCHSPLVPP